MRSPRLLTLLLAALGAVAFTSAAVAAGLSTRLQVDRSWLGPHDDVVARVVLTNEGRETLWIPRWQVPKADMDADLFEVVQNGRQVGYVGRLAKRPAATKADFVALRPGQTLRAQTELSRHYKMHGGGEYLVSYRIDLLDGVYMDELRGGADAVYSNAVTLWRDAVIDDGRIDWDAWNAPTVGAEGVTTSGACSPQEVNTITTAFNSATTYAGGALSYLNLKSWSTVGARYTTWFGATDSNRFNTVKSHFVSIDDAFRTKSVVVDCSCNQSYYAYVYKNDHYRIYVCNAFWTANNTGTDSRAGTLIHEMSHFDVVASTDDWAYGQSACKKLTKRPTKAIDNADSHEYFSENTPNLN